MSKWDLQNLALLRHLCWTHLMKWPIPKADYMEMIDKARLLGNGLSSFIHNTPDKEIIMCLGTAVFPGKIASIHIRNQADIAAGNGFRLFDLDTTSQNHIDSIIAKEKNVRRIISDEQSAKIADIVLSLDREKDKESKVVFEVLKTRKPTAWQDYKVDLNGFGSITEAYNSEYR